MENSSLDHEESRAECQRYLTSFRVLELKELLKLYGQSTKGRKPELFQKANDILQYASPKFHTKVREIYERSNSCKRQLSYGRASQKHSATVKSSETVLKNPSRPYIVHPDVRFKAHPFFSKLDTITRPTALVSSSIGHGSLSMKLKFHLTPQQIHQIYVSKTSTGTYQTQVLVRFCLQETTSDQNDFYPKQCFVKVNGHSSPLPGYHPHLSTRADYKRTGQPINITNFVKTSPAEINEVIVYWSHDIMLSQGYCVGIEVAEVVSSSDLLQSLKAKGVRSPDMSRALVKEKFTVDKDSEVAATSMKVSLLCPIGKMRMNYPCRTTYCSHLQCFDASIFFQMNEKRARWVCPVCDKAALPGDLFIDGLFMEICQKSASSNNIIEFSTDGSWQTASETTGSSLIVGTSDVRGNSPISIDTPESSSKMVVIDLTVSSDEEEEGEEEVRIDGEEGELGDTESDVGEDSNRGDNNHRLEPPSLDTGRCELEDISSDSETTESPQSSSTITAPSPPEPRRPNLFPHLSIPLSSEHASRFMFPAPLHSHATALPNTDRTTRLSRQQSEHSVIVTTSVPRFSSDSHQATISASSSSSSSAMSLPMSVIMQSRPHSIPRHHSHSHSHPRFGSHSRIRKRSHSGSHSNPYTSHSSHCRTSHSSHSHSRHTLHSPPSSHHKHTHSSSGVHCPWSGGSSSRGEGASEPSQGMSHVAPYVPVATGYPTAGDALLTSSMSFDENILRATFMTTSHEQAYSHKEPPKD